MPDASQILSALTRAKSPEDYHGVVRGSLKALDQIQVRSNPKVACREGCSLCCWLRVDVRAPEVFLIADYVRTRFSAQALGDLLERLTSHCATVITISPFEHATRNLACPLLQDGRCSIYSARPAACRRHHSLDLAACQFTFDHPTDLEFPSAHDRELFREVSEAMASGAEVYAQAGFDNTIYELGSALTEALQNPASWRRWRDRKKAFLRASITPEG